MARPKKLAPEYRYHVSGQAVVTFNGTNFYLGPHGTPESEARYRSLVAEYIASGGETPKANTHQIDQPLLISDLCAEVMHWVKDHYADDKQQLSRLTNLCTLLQTEYGATPASEFGPRKLAALRELFIAAGNCRKYVNTQTNNVVRIFKIALSREIIEADVIVRLKSLEPLRQRKTRAPERDKVSPADIEHVAETAKHLSPTLKAMVRIQVATGMRPSELCVMRPCDIDMTDDSAWVYRPIDHKNAHRGKARSIPIMDDARAAVVPFLSRHPEAFCFAPAESVEWFRQQRATARITPLNEGNRRGKGSRKNVRNDATSRRPGSCFTRDSYRRAIERAAIKAGVPHWFPYQLRHLAATVVRDALGVEAAQALLGHSRPSMTEHYARLQERKAIEAAKAAPRLKLGLK